MVTSDHYVKMLFNFLEPQLHQLKIDIGTVWFQQNRATFHTARVLMVILRKLFLGCLISQNGDIPWPTYSLTWALVIIGYRVTLRGKSLLQDHRILLTWSHVFKTKLLQFQDKCYNTIENLQTGLKMWWRLK